jgi:ADP-ribose pyrophosphatase YjhB (NUDIX family)
MMPRAYPAAPIVGVGAVIVTDAGEIVIVQRGQPPLAGRWSLPGGVVEVGESLRAAVAREVREETGLEVEVGLLVEVVERIFRDAADRVEYHYVLTDYVCRPRGGVMCAASDALDARAVPPSSLGDYALAADTLRVIRRGLELLGGGA